MGWDGIDWIYLAQDKYQWQDFVNTEIKLLYHKIMGNSLVAERLATSQE
jgi:hypothetical protein